jgi:hypothetical protein
MALGLYFQPSGFTPDLYDEAIKQLEQAGAGFGKVPGRIFHCAMEAGGPSRSSMCGSRWSSSRSSERR